MGTRGLYGFKKNGEMKATYNHYDSYPEWLGQNIVDFIKTTTIDEMNEIFKDIMLVEEGSTPTEEQIKVCMKYYNGSVSNRSTDDWYCLLREAQGDLNPYKDGLIYMIDSSDFLKDKGFCEYAYLINLDTNKLEFYASGELLKEYSFLEQNIIEDMNKIVEEKWGD